MFITAVNILESIDKKYLYFYLLFGLKKQKGGELYYDFMGPYRSPKSIETKLGTDCCFYINVIVVNEITLPLRRDLGNQMEFPQ